MLYRSLIRQCRGIRRQCRGTRSRFGPQSLQISLISTTFQRTQTRNASFFTQKCNFKFVSITNARSFNYMNHGYNHYNHQMSNHFFRHYFRRFTNANKPATTMMKKAWTRVVYHPWMQAFNRSGIKHPIIWACFASTAKSMISDLIAQKGIEKRNWSDFNYERFVLFALFGLVYGGWMQYGVYVKIYPFLFNRIRSQMQRAWITTTVDMCIHSTLLYMPLFYIMRGMIYERQISIQVWQKSLNLYFKVNFKDDVKALFKVWTVPIFLMFFVIPVHFHVPWIGAVAVVWTTVLSLMRGDRDESEKDNGNENGNEIELIGGS